MGNNSGYETKEWRQLGAQMDVYPFWRDTLLPRFGLWRIVDGLGIQMTQIVLADDQAQVCSALKLLLEQKSQACITGEAANAQDLLTLAQTAHPDIILLDWELPGLHANDGVSLVRRAYPSTRIVALSSHPEARRLALQAGVDAFVCKGDPPEALLTAVHNLSAAHQTRR